MRRARTLEELRAQATVVLRDTLRDVRDGLVPVERAEEALLRLLDAYVVRHDEVTRVAGIRGGPDVPRPAAIAEAERAVTAARRQLLAAGDDPEAEARARALLAAAEHRRGLVWRRLAIRRPTLAASWARWALSGVFPGNTQRLAELPQSSVCRWGLRDVRPTARVGKGVASITVTCIRRCVEDALLVVGVGPSRR